MVNKFGSLFFLCLLVIFIYSVNSRELRGLQEDTDDFALKIPTPSLTNLPSSVASFRPTVSVTTAVATDISPPPTVSIDIVDKPSVEPTKSDKTELVSSHPTPTKTENPVSIETKSPIVSESVAPTVGKSEAPTVADTYRPSVRDSVAPTIVDTEKPSFAPSQEQSNVPEPVVDVPVPTIIKSEAPTKGRTLTDSPTPADPVVTPSPTVPTGTDSGTGTDTPVVTEEPEDLSNSTTTFVLVVIIGLVAFVLYRMYCKPSGALPPGELSSSTAPSYSRLAQSENHVDDEDLGDIEMHGGGSHAFDDNAEIWEEWETNEDVNPPSLQQAMNSYNAAPKVATSAPEYSRSSSLEDTQISSSSRSNSNVNFTTLPPAPSPISPTLPAPLSGGNLGSLGSLGVNTKIKPTTSGGNIGGLGASKSKSRSALTPPADVDLFAVRL